MFYHVFSTKMNPRGASIHRINDLFPLKPPLDIEIKVKESITWIAWADNLGNLISSIRDADLASSFISSHEEIISLITRGCFSVSSIGVIWVLCRKIVIQFWNNIWGLFSFFATKKFLVYVNRSQFSKKSWKKYFTRA